MPVDGLVEERAGESRVGLTERDAQNQDLSREGVKDRADHDGPEGSSDLGEINDEDFPRTFGAEGRAEVSGHLRESAWGRASEDRLDAGPGGFEAQPGQNARDSAGTPARPFASEIPDKFLDQSGKAIHGRSGLDEMTHAPEEVPAPVYDGLDRDEKGPGRGAGGKAMPGRVPEDVEPLKRAIPRPSAGRESSEASPEEAILGAEFFDPLVENIHFGGQGSSAGDLGSPAVVSETDPAGNKH